MDHLLIPKIRAELCQDILGPVVGDEPGLGNSLRKRFQGPLDHALHIVCGHGASEVPMHNESGIFVQDAGKEGVGSPKIDIGKVRMPLVMRPERLIKARPMRFLTVGDRPLAGETGLLQGQSN